MLEVKNVTIKYGERVVIEDASFTAPPGRIVAMLGANGAGKTTLLRAVNGGVPISAGEISIDGDNIRNMDRRQIARKAAVVAQENETKFPVTVNEFILAGRFARSLGFGGESDTDNLAAEKAMKECGLFEFRGRYMNELSGGERQRVVLARALAAETGLLLLDEPTANLDLAHQALMFRLIQKKCKESGLAAIIITHDLNLAAEFADLLMLLADGRIIAFGESEEVITPENLLKVYAMNVLIDKNPSSGKLRVTTMF